MYRVIKYQGGFMNRRLISLVLAGFLFLNPTKSETFFDGGLSFLAGSVVLKSIPVLMGMGAGMYGLRWLDNQQIERLRNEMNTRFDTVNDKLNDIENTIKNNKKDINKLSSNVDVYHHETTTGLNDLKEEGKKLASKQEELLTQLQKEKSSLSELITAKFDNLKEDELKDLSDKYDGIDSKIDELAEQINTTKTQVKIVETNITKKISSLEAEFRNETQETRTMIGDVSSNVFGISEEQARQSRTLNLLEAMTRENLETSKKNEENLKQIRTVMLTIASGTPLTKEVDQFYDAGSSSDLTNSSLTKAFCGGLAAASISRSSKSSSNMIE